MAVAMTGPSVRYHQSMVKAGFQAFRGFLRRPAVVPRSDRPLRRDRTVSGRFRHEYAGQLGSYVATVDDQLRGPEVHAATVGIHGCCDLHLRQVAIGGAGRPLAVDAVTQAFTGAVALSAGAQGDDPDAVTAADGTADD